jgi:lycopene beta-cyclase
VTYLQFHLIFILPPLLVLAIAARRAARSIDRPLAFVPLVAIIAFVYTTPWDNYLVRRGVWWYGPERVIGTVGYVPVEEYAFFVLQPLLTGFWLYIVLAAAPGREPLGSGVRAWGSAGYALLALGGLLALSTDSGLYAGLILTWAAPVLAAQWAFAGGEIWRRRRAFAAAVIVPTVYLWVADAIAIQQGIWEISERFTVGIGVAGLPLEEALFFLLTNLLVVQGILLFLHPPARRPLGVSRRYAPPPAEAGNG